MNTERWRVLSEWHNTWLAAPADQRALLRASFAAEHPELLQVADGLAASGTWRRTSPRSLTARWSDRTGS